MNREGLLEGPVQIAYHVEDARRAALACVDLTGAGPFFVAEKIQLSQATHRGRQCNFVHTSAYGQSGSMMLEFVQQDDDGPSPFRDLYNPDEEGIHHVAYFARNLEAAVDHFAAQDMKLATWAETVGGQSFVFIDATRQLGHMIELYEPTDLLLGFYDLIKTSAENWQGEEPVRTTG